ADRAPRLVEAVELAPLLEERRFRRVEVLGLAFAEDASTETDDVSTRVENRKHHAIAEAVIAARGFGVGVLGLVSGIDDEPRVLHDRRGVIGEHALEVLPSIGRVAKAVARGDFTREAPALEVVDGDFRFLELGAIE